VTTNRNPRGLTTLSQTDNLEAPELLLQRTERSVSRTIGYDPRVTRLFSPAPPGAELKAEWGVTKTNRKARFYKITPLGLRQLEQEQNRWLELSSAVAQVLKLA
jgi:hypothetical protein